jgi:hypothetical protein
LSDPPHQKQFPKYTVEKHDSSQPDTVDNAPKKNQQASNQEQYRSLYLPADQ